MRIHAAGGRVTRPSLCAVLLYDSPIRSSQTVVGAGAMGMAFTDVLMTETEASVVMVDRRHQPGGHWNDAYPFVRLHQPSSFYGVNSRPLGQRRDRHPRLEQGPL